MMQLWSRPHFRYRFFGCRVRLPARINDDPHCPKLPQSGTRNSSSYNNALGKMDIGHGALFLCNLRSSGASSEHQNVSAP